MGPNDAELVRVFTRELGKTVGDVTFSIGTDFEIAVDVEAGDAIFNAGTNFETKVILRDLSKNNNIKVDPDGYGGPGKTTDTPDWPTQGYTFVHKVKKTNLTGRVGDLCQVLAFVRVGQDNSFELSPLFVLTK